MSFMASELVQQINPGPASYGALAVQICEFANYFFDEVEYLYRGRFTVVKLLYIWSRYVPLIAQIISFALTHEVYQPPLRGRLCVATFVYRTILSQQTMVCLDLILLVRVYALYNQNRRVKYFLSMVFLTTCALEIWSSGRMVWALIKGKSCIPGATPPLAIVIFCVSVASFQGLILCMTVFKYVVGHHYGWARTPLTSLLLREGITVCFLISGMLVINGTYYEYSIRTLGSALGDGLAVGNAAFAWYISLLSVTGCRLILDIRKLAISRTERSSDEIEFTSNLDLS